MPLLVVTGLVGPSLVFLVLTMTTVAGTATCGPTQPRRTVRTGAVGSWLSRLGCRPDAGAQLVRACLAGQRRRKSRRGRIRVGRGRLGRPEEPGAQEQLIGIALVTRRQCLGCSRLEYVGDSAEELLIVGQGIRQWRQVRRLGQVGGHLRQAGG